MDAALSEARLTVDTSPLSQIDKRFLHILFASLLAHLLIAMWVNHQPHVVAEEPVYTERPRERVTLPPLQKIPKSFPPLPPSKKPGKTPGPGGPGPSLTGLVAAAIDDLKSGATENEEALRGATQGPLDTTLIASRRERGPAEVQNVGPVVTNGVQTVAIGEHRDAAVGQGKVEDIVIDEPQELPDPSQWMRYIKQRSTAITACYERELKHNPTLKGRVTVHFTVATDGRPREIDVSPDTLRSHEVTACIEGVIRRWIFPVKPAGDVPLQFPVLFTPTGA